MAINVSLADRIADLSSAHTTHENRTLIVAKKMWAIEGELQHAIVLMATVHPGLSVAEVDLLKAISIRLEHAKQEMAEAVVDERQDYLDMFTVLHEILVT